MVNDDVIKCPLCGGFTHVQQQDLLTALQNTDIRKKVEIFIAELLQSPTEELASVSAGGKPRTDFQKDVHKWNPNVPMWRRSSKE